MPMTPMEYKARYESIRVPLKDGGEKTIKVNSYRLRVMPKDSYGGYNQTAHDAFMAALKKNKIDTELRVDTDDGPRYLDPDIEPDTSPFRMDPTANGDLPMHGKSAHKNEPPNDMWTLANYVFAGKGSPEACQIVLQLANAWGLAPDVQKYADDALGLDCNGFVGNWMWHCKKEKDWTDLGYRNMDLGADATIDSFLESTVGTPLKKWNDLNGAKTYIMGMVKGGQIVKGGGGLGDAGHITITQPGFVRSPNPKNKGKDLGVYVVESTASHKPGLWQSFYYLESEDNGVFTLKRPEMMHPTIPVRMIEVRP